MLTLWQDLRYGARLLIKKPGFAFVVILTLTLGIGANTAIFSVVNAFLLRPLPYGEPDRLVMVDSQYRGSSIGVSFVDYEDWRKQNHVFEDIAFFNLRWNANLEFGNETETLNLTFGTPNLFSTLRVTPELGRGPALEGIVVLDGTWSKAKTLWWRSEYSGATTADRGHQPYCHRSNAARFPVPVSNRFMVAEGSILQSSESRLSHRSIDSPSQTRRDS